MDSNGADLSRHQPGSQHLSAENPDQPTQVGEMDHEAAASAAQFITSNQEDADERASNISQASISSEMRIELYRKRAELKAEMELESQQRQFELQQMQQTLQKQQHERMLKLQKEMRALQFLDEDLKRLEQLEGIIPLANDPIPTHNSGHHQGTSTQQINTLPSNDFPVQTSISEQFSEILRSLQAQYKVSNLPNCEPPIFDGTDPTLYPAFKIAFQALISSKCDSPRDKLFYLQKYTSEGPRRLVNGCLSDGPTGYENAMHLLEEKYGNKYVVACAYLDKLKNWPNMRNGAALELEKFSLYLTEVNCCMSSINGLEELNTFQQLKDLSEKLPYNLRSKWVMEADELMREGKLTFTHFVKYVKQQARVLNNPVFGSILCNNKPKSEDSTAVSFLTKNQQQEPEEEFETGTHENSDTSATEYSSRESVPKVKKKKEFYCFYCSAKNSHYMRDCPEMMKFTANENISWLIEQNRCVNCFKKASASHTKKTCKIKVKCAKCDNAHPTILHRESGSQNKVVKSEVNDSEKLESENVRAGSYSCKNSSSKVKYYFPIVSCKIENPARPGSFVTTNAVLDSASSNNFIDLNLLKKMKVNCETQDISLTTLAAQSETKCSVPVIKNLQITNILGTEKFTLQSVYGKENWPFDQFEIPSKMDINHLPNLKDLPFNFIEEKVGLLIGLENTEILQPLESVKAKAKNLMAVNFPLGWSLLGQEIVNK